MDMAKIPLSSKKVRSLEVVLVFCKTELMRKMFDVNRFAV